MSTQDQRFTDIAPKVYYTICNPVKVCCEYPAAWAFSLAALPTRSLGKGSLSRRRHSEKEKSRRPSRKRLRTRLVNTVPHSPTYNPAVVGLGPTSLGIKKDTSKYKPPAL